MTAKTNQLATRETYPCFAARSSKPTLGTLFKHFWIFCDMQVTTTVDRASGNITLSVTASFSRRKIQNNYKTYRDNNQRYHSDGHFCCWKPSWQSHEMVFH